MGVGRRSQRSQVLNGGQRPVRSKKLK
jgi:hypothetical protein